VLSNQGGLIERVYKEVYLDRWQHEWEAVLHDLTELLERRLIDFYESYLPAIFRYDWVWIFVFARLRGVGITQRYLDLIQKRVIDSLGFQLRDVAGLMDEPDRALSEGELEIAWSLHGELFYLAIRRWVNGMKTPDDLGPIIRAAVVRFLEGAPGRDVRSEKDPLGQRVAATTAGSRGSSRGRGRAGATGAFILILSCYP
jgi:hypothetical protein